MKDHTFSLKKISILAISKKKKNTERSFGAFGFFHKDSKSASALLSNQNTKKRRHPLNQNTFSFKRRL